ncbi:MAG TPA: hypothetical protein VK152_11425 [Paludibacter sp.]|nr:hypothetical protein [Paludibacter sp.]
MKLSTKLLVLAITFLAIALSSAFISAQYYIDSKGIFSLLNQLSNLTSIMAVITLIVFFLKRYSVKNGK